MNSTNACPKTEWSPYQHSLICSKECHENSMLLDECLLLLSSKRRTLEEKIIIKYFQELACSIAGIIKGLHMCMLRTPIIEPSQHDLERLQTVNEKLSRILSDLLKILNYDFNFLEQYFEHDFSSSLLSNSLNEEFRNLELLISGLAEAESSPKN